MKSHFCRSINQILKICCRLRIDLHKMMQKKERQRKKETQGMVLTFAVAYVGPDPSIKITPSSEAFDIAYRKREWKLKLRGNIL